MHATFPTASLLRTIVVRVFLACSLCVSPGVASALRGASAVSGGKAAPPAANGSVRGMTARTQEAPQRAGELIVRFREGVGEELKGAVVSSRGARRKARLRGEGRLEKVELQHGQDVSAVAELLRVDPSVEFVEPNFLITRAQILPNDERFSEQWALRNTGQTGGRNGADIGAARAWRATRGDRSTAIAVIDSGIDFTHADLRDNQWTNRREREDGRDNDHNGYTDDRHGWDWVTDSGVIRDEQGHGTSLAGVLAAEGNNRRGVAGVMWRASLMSLRVLDQTGTGDIASAVEAIDYAVANGAQVVNCSWGTDAESLALRDAIARAGARGVVVVASAGNGGRDLEAFPYYPASFNLPNLIVVGSTNSSDQLTPWSNYGAQDVAVAAPGESILTTQMGGGYWMVSGTSVSAPLVSGIAGLLKSEQPWASAEAMRAAITGGARRVAALEGKVSSGGVASADGALEQLEQFDPYVRPPGNGNGGGNGGGNNGGGGNGQDWRNLPPAPSGRGHGGRFTGRPPDPTRGAPAGAPNLDEIRRQRSSVPSGPPAQIRSNLAPVCDDCYEGGGSDPEFSTARTRPENETGQQGVDLGSRNFNWATPLVGLPGRSGLDLNLTLFYNSLVWIKQNSSVQFNPDNGFPAPGFRLGFPMLQKQFIDSDTGGLYAYVMVTPSGGRVKLVQVGTSNIYEAIDGSYAQMTDAGASTVVRTSDGTQYLFGLVLANGEKRCTQIKDRNGNYMTIAYDGSNRIDYVTDTLLRVVDFVYDVDGNLSSLSQTRAGMVSTLASFSYGSLLMQPSFTGVWVFGPSNQYISVLTRVTFADGSYYQFSYTPFGQVYKITHFAQDNTQLTYTGYNLPGSDWLGVSAQSDCPRFTQRRDWIKWGVMGADGETVTSYSVDPNGAWSQVTLPDDTPANPNDNVVHKEYFATTGWQRGLTTRTETFLAGTPQSLKKWTTMSWTQDDVSLIYQKNPRPTQINIEDAEGNHRRTIIGYVTVSGITLPSEVQEHGKVNGVLTLLRRTTTDYRWDAVYLDRRIVGLAERRQVFDGGGTVVSKVTYGYDWDWNGDMFQDTPAPATQHDRANYGPSLIYGRGNLSQLARWDVNDPENASKTQETKWRVNSTGSVLIARDHLWHQTLYEYNDSFSDGTNRNTFAYPTKVIDPEGYQATTQYKYETGATTQATRPASGTSAQGNVAYETVVLNYDTVGRLDNVNNLNANASDTRFVYSASMLYVVQWTTVVAGLGETSSEQHFDGAGRVRATSGQHPGSAGGNRAVFVLYDSLGRVAHSSKPTEINIYWTPVGDDAAGWVWTSQTYDWQGRPLLTTNPDASTRELTYGGCGCAGGAVVTMRDEAGRRRKAYHDAVGRMWKVEELNLDQTLYATAQYTYNARDQITEVNHGGQLRTLAYDGHGRLSSQTTPEQGTTTFTYHGDDTVQTVTDARGATRTFTYNARHLPTAITYGEPAGVAPSPNVSFAYDAAGSRTQMVERDDWNNLVGQTDYQYDALSRLTSETRQFTGLGSFTLTYAYNLAGEIASVVNPWGSQVSYGRDLTGRVTGITGAGQMSASVYAQGFQYRAWNAIKQVSFGNGRQLSVSYDNRMRPVQWQVPSVLGFEYSYIHFGENTGRVTFARNLVSNGALDSRLDRSYEYDQVGRLTKAYTGVNAQAHTGQGGSWGPTNGPYTHNFTYDVWGNQTQQGTYANNKRVGFAYDAVGNITADQTQSFTYDAEGQQAAASHPGYLLTQTYDGDRLRVKKTENGVTSYFLRSSVFGGQVIAELNSAGTWTKGYVYDAGGNFLAFQKDGTVYWVHQDPVTKSKRLTDTSGTVFSTVEVTPFGDDTGSFSNNRWVQKRMYTSYERDGNASDEAHHRRYNRFYARFDQPDPYEGSYDLTDPQSFNRYSYVQNDPVNFVDPSGLNMAGPDTRYGPCTPGSARCSDAFAAGYPFLPGFNHFDWMHGSGESTHVHTLTVHSFNYGFCFGQDCMQEHLATNAIRNAAKYRTKIEN